MHLFGEPLALMTGVFLLLALGLALSFEFVNGFHDTANAVATVIYTHTLPPMAAVIWSGCWNLIGVLMSSGAVAFGVLALLPVELVINAGSGPGFAMVFSLLISAIVWNLGTWYLGLPASSSHTLIGSIMGVGLANSLMSPAHVLGGGVNWDQVKQVFASLILSPIVGFVCAGLLLLLCKVLIKRPELYHAPEGTKPPPPLIRALLVLTCTGVSFAHGSNDGQKGMGLIMLILVGILPGAFALNMKANAVHLKQIAAASQSADKALDQHTHGATIDAPAARQELLDYLKSTGSANDRTFTALEARNHDLEGRLDKITGFAEIPTAERRGLRGEMYLISETIGKLDKHKAFTDPAEKKAIIDYKTSLEKATKFIPDWVKIAVACALGLGTMIGWKRIVVTVGEKIGKEHLSYAQGASAELVAMATIGAADHFGLPVSTTHVLSSGVAGTMAANHSGLQMGTLRNLLLAWVLTLPVCVLLGATTFAASLYVVLHVIGVK